MGTHTERQSRPPFSKKAARGLRHVIVLVTADLQCDTGEDRQYPDDHDIHAALVYLEKLDDWMRSRASGGADRG